MVRVNPYLYIHCYLGLREKNWVMYDNLREYMGRKKHVQFWKANAQQWFLWYISTP